MPKASPIQTSFNGGEFSPNMDGHINAPTRNSALKACENLIPLKQGPVTRRGGTKFVNPIKDNTKPTATVEFEFNVEQAYIIEFGDQYMRFYKNNGVITETGIGITAATQANPVVLTVVGHGYTDGDWVFILDVVGMTELNGSFFKIDNSTANTFELQDVYGNNIDGTGFGVYLSGGTANRVHEIVTPYLQEDLFNPDGSFRFKFTQSADVLYIVHNEYPQRKLTRTGDTSWTLTQIDFRDGPYLITNSTDTTINPSGTTGSITLTASDPLFAATDIDRLVRMQHGSTWGYAKITGFTNDTLVSADVINDFGASTAQTDWRLGVWSNTTGFPSAVTFFQDRLVFGGATQSPQRIDGSNTGDYENFQPTDTDGVVADDMSISFTLNARGVNVIRWLTDNERGLIAGTTGGEWIIRASTGGEALTPTNVQATRPSTNGSNDTQAAVAGNSTLYIQRAGRKIQQFSFSFQDDGFTSPDLTLLADHIGESGFIDAIYQQEPHNILWCLRQDGRFAGLTYVPEQRINAWHFHQIGGFSDAEKTVHAKVESTSVIPSADGSRDELWMIVNRFIDGRTTRYMEFMTQTYDDTIAQEDAIHVDSNLTFSGAATDTISGLEHLEGETVELMVNGGAHPDVVVTNGTITLREPATKVQIGLTNSGKMTLLKLEAGAADGTAQGKIKRTNKCSVRLLNTLGVLYGFDGGQFDEIIFQTEFLDTAPPLFTGDKTELPWPGGYNRDMELTFKTSGPFPMTILAVMPQVHTTDR